MTSAEAHTGMLDQLRDTVRAEGGDWTTRRAVDALNGQPSTDRAWVLLAELAREGLLIGNGPVPDFWTVAAPVDLDEFTAAVIQKIATIPGVVFAEQVDGQPPGLIGVKVGHPTDDYFFVKVTR